MDALEALEATHCRHISIPGPVTAPAAPRLGALLLQPQVGMLVALLVLQPQAGTPVTLVLQSQAGMPVTLVQSQMCQSSATPTVGTGAHQLPQMCHAHVGVWSPTPCPGSTDAAVSIMINYYLILFIKVLLISSHYRY